jgi:acyl carrier protein
MEKLKQSLQEIFETNDLNMNAKMTDLESWDSLASLSVIAMLDADYGIMMKNAELEAFNTISEFCDYVITNKK